MQRVVGGDHDYIRCSCATKHATPRKFYNRGPRGRVAIMLALVFAIHDVAAYEPNARNRAASFQCRITFWRAMCSHTKIPLRLIYKTEFWVPHQRHNIWFRFIQRYSARNGRMDLSTSSKLPTDDKGWVQQKSFKSWAPTSPSWTNLFPPQDPHAIK